jgi:hypothetical protein
MLDLTSNANTDPNTGRNTDQRLDPRLDPRVRAEIARRNGARSKGPKTEAGKAKSAQNGIKHGLRSDNLVVLRNENPAIWQSVLDTFHARYRPADRIEEELVEDIAFCLWRLRRVRGVESALWDIAMEDQADELEAKYSTPTELTRKAYAFKSEANLQLVSRYEGRLRRAYDRAIHNLAQYRSGRGASAGTEDSSSQNEK